MENQDALSPLTLAFIGDAVHTLYVRQKVTEHQGEKIANYHVSAKKFCNAKSQKEALEKLSPILNENEQNIVRRARNAKAKHKAKNFNEEEYKKATAFEALVGYLFVSEQKERLKQILDISMES